MRYELALREPADTGPYLVFPSQLSRDWEDAPDPTGKALIIGFEGAIHNVYATLVVRLANSVVFERREMWRNAVTFHSNACGGRCGLYMRHFAEAQAEMILFFDDLTTPTTRNVLEAFVQAHLDERALDGSVKLRRMVVCAYCGEPIPDRTERVRRERGLNWETCAACDEQMSLVAAESKEDQEREALVAQMRREADSGRDRATAAAVIAGKRQAGDYDVFLCHNSRDKEPVRAIAAQLIDRGILPWFDEREVKPGVRWQPELEKHLKRCRSAAVFLGARGKGPWQDVEVEVLLNRYAKSKKKPPIIPVILPGRKAKNPGLPDLLQLYQKVDFRIDDPDPIQMLIWGTTGEREGGGPF